MPLSRPIAGRHKGSVARALALALVALGLPVAPLASAAGPSRPSIASQIASLTAESDLVVHGLVLSTKARWVDDARGRHIRTYATVRPHAWLKGAGGREAVVEFLGGAVGEMREEVTPAIKMSPGEEVVLFLKRRPGGAAFSVAGGHTGKFLIERGAAHGALGRMPMGDFLEHMRKATGAVPSLADGPEQPPAAPKREGKPQRDPAAKDASELPATSRSASYASAAVLQAAARAATTAGWTTIKSEDFEGAWPNDWTLYVNNRYYDGKPITWGTVTSYKHAGSKGAWAHGATGYDPAGYNLFRGAAVISRMTYGPFDLRGCTDARLSFWRTYQLDTNDVFRWEVSTDGAIWVGYNVQGVSVLPTWGQTTLSLRDDAVVGNLCGRSGIYFRFVCEAAASGSAKGPFVDDVLIEKYVVDNMPDTVIDSFTVTPRQSTQGATLTASVTVRNAGTGAVGSFNVDFYRSRTSAPGSGDAGDYTWTVPGLAAGASTVLTWNLSPAAAAGTHHAYAVIDRSNAVAEYDEANNKEGPISYYVTQTGWEVMKLEDFEGSWYNDWSLTSRYSNRGTWAPQTWLASDAKAGGGQASLVDPVGDPGTIEADTWSRMTYGPFSLAGASQARMTFLLSYQLGTSNTVRWEGSTNGTTFSGGGSQTGGSNLGSWTPVTFDLSAFLGSSSAYVRISCEPGLTDEYVKGPFVDDIVIERTGTSLPWISSISPASGSANTNTQVTITGTNFGATQGAGSVQFFFAPYNTKIAASVVTWSSTSIVCKIPASASSGPVTVMNDAGAESNNYAFAVTFSYGGAKWASGTVSYYINENTSDCTGEGAAVQAAAATWSSAGAAFALQYAGARSVTSASKNGYNEIFWTTSPEQSGSAALATTWYSGSDVVEGDIAFNDTLAWSIGGGGNTNDVETIALHELGHWLKLADLYGDIGDGVNDIAKALCGTAVTGSTRRTLATADRDGIQWIYPNVTLGISVNPTSWSIAGAQPQGGTCLSSSGTRFAVQNTGTVTESLRLKILTPDSLGKWAAGSSVGSDRYWLSALFCGSADMPVAGDFASEDTVTTSVQAATATRFNRPAGTYGVSMAASALAYLWFRLDLPNPVSDGSQHQITVEVSCETP